MSSMIGEAFVRLRSDDTGYRGEVDRQVTRNVRQVEAALGGSNREMARFSRGALVGTGALGSLGRAAAFASVSFIGGAGLIYALKSSSSAASNLSEQISKSRVVFGESSRTIEEWSRTSATAMGIARDQAVEVAGSFGALLRPLGQTESQAARTSIQLAQLGADLASFSDTPVPEALAAIRSGLVGEIEPLRRYGVVLSEAGVQQEALATTGKKAVSELTAQEKVAARLSLIFKQTTLAQGDFARTAGGLANQERTLSANLRDLQIILGQALNPEIQRVVTNLNEWLGNTKNQEKVQRELETAVRDGTAIVEGFAKGLDTIRKIVSPLVDLVGGLTRAIELLILAMAVSTVRKFALALGLIGPAAATAATVTTATTAIEGVGVAAGVSAGRVAFLRSALLRLGALGVIAVGIEILLNRDKIDQAVRDFLDDHGLPGGSNPVDINKNFDDLPDWLKKKIVPRLPALGHRLDAIEGLRGQRDLATRRINPLPGLSGQGFLSRSLSDSERLAIRIAQNPDDVQALTAQRAQAQRSLNFALDQIKAHRGNTKKFAEAAERLSNEITGINQHLAGIQAANAAAAAAATAEAQRKAEEARKRAIEAIQRQREQARDSIIKSLRADKTDLTAGSPLALFRGFVLPAKEVDAFKARLAALTQVPESLQLQTQIAEQRFDDDKKLLPFLEREETALQKRLRILKRSGGTEQEILTATLNLETLRRRERDIRKAGLDKANNFSLSQLFAEAGSQFATYGSNIGPRGASLSQQDARASVKGSLDKVRGDTIIVQNFHGERNPAQAIYEAANAARALK